MENAHGEYTWRMHMENAHGEYTFYSKRTHSIVREHIFDMENTHGEYTFKHQAALAASFSSRSLLPVL